MILFDPTLFLAALSQLLKSDGVAISFSEDELCYMANSECAPEHQLPYAAYVAFISQLATDGPDAYTTTPNAAAFYQVYALIKTEMLRQKLAMVKAIVDGQPNWRALKWLLDRRDKLDRSRKQKGNVAAIDYCVVAAGRPQPQQPVALEKAPDPMPENKHENTQSRKKRTRYRGPLGVGAPPTSKSFTPIKSNDEDENPARNRWRDTAKPYMRQRGVIY